MDRLIPISNRIKTIGSHIRSGHRGGGKLGVVGNGDIGACSCREYSREVGDCGQESTLGVGGVYQGSVPVVRSREDRVFVLVPYLRA